jgi:uncharacterized OB-fold protein
MDDSMITLGSAHQQYDSSCTICRESASTVSWFEDAAREAAKLGSHQCVGCDYVFYLTIDMCPHCGLELKGF